jgi:hypothetical protein
MRKPYIVVSCPADTFSGYGARSRDVLLALIKNNKYDVQVMSQRWGNTPFGFLKEDNPKHKSIKDRFLPNNQLTRQPDVWIQITVPNEFQKVGKYNIGITAGIETSFCAPQWLEGLNRMDLNLVSSQHSKKVFETTNYEKKDQQGNTQQIIKLEKPVDVLFEGVDVEKYFTIDKFSKSDIKTSLDSIKEDFGFLFVGHWLQGHLGEDRKNLGLTIKTFLESFKNKTGKKPALILKTALGPSSIMNKDEILKRIDAIKRMVGGKNLPNIYLIHGDLTDEEMNILYNHPKVKTLVNLAKGEGFGRPLLEFSQSRKPIIASNWSGHLDFLHPDYTSLVPGETKPIHASAQVKDMLMPDSQWFQFDIDYAIKLFKDYFKNYKTYVTKNRKLKKHCKENFSFDKMVDVIENIIDKNAPKQVEIKIPKIQKISKPTKPQK